MPLSYADGHHGRGGSLVPTDSSVDIKRCILGRTPLVCKLVLELLSPHLEAAPRTVRQRRRMSPFGRHSHPIGLRQQACIDHINSMLGQALARLGHQGHRGVHASIL
jgi:hypothetical protein